MDKRIVSLVWALAALIGVVAVRFPLASASSLIEVSVSPQSSSVSVGQSFSVNITIANFPSPGLFSYQFSLYYDSAILQCIAVQIPSDYFLKPTNPSNIFIVDPGTINQSAGCVTFVLTLLGNELGKTGSGVLASVQFTGLAAGISLFELRDVHLMNSNSSQFPTDQYSLRQGSIKVVQQISIADYDVSFGSDFTVESVLQGASTIAGASFDVYFNKSVVNAVSVSSGDFGAPVYVIDNDSGIVKISTVGAVAVGKDVATLAKITFHGIRGGSTPLQLQNAQLNDEKGSTIAPLTRDGSIFVHNPQITISSCYTDVGSTVNVSIVVLNAENVAGGSMNMTFDTSVFNVVCVFPGDFGVPIVDIRNNESTVSLTFASASAVGRPNATLAVLSCTGMSKGIAFFRVENAELNDEQGNLVIPEVFEQGSLWGSLGVPPGVPGVPEFQPIGILLVCLLLGSIVVVMRKKLLGKRSALPRIQKQ